MTDFENKRISIKRSPINRHPDTTLFNNMNCKNCGKEFIGKHHYQKYCVPECRNIFHKKNTCCRVLKERERLFTEEFNSLNYKDDPLVIEPHRDFERSCQLQTVVRTGLYVSYKLFDDQDFIGVKKLTFCQGCMWIGYCKRDRKNDFYPVGCKSFLRGH